MLPSVLSVAAVVICRRISLEKPRRGARRATDPVWDRQHQASAAPFTRQLSPLARPSPTVVLSDDLPRADVPEARAWPAQNEGRSPTSQRHGQASRTEESGGQEKRTGMASRPSRSFFAQYPNNLATIPK